MLLPRKLYSQYGRVCRACRAGMAPAQEALFSIRQGVRSLLGLDGSCPSSSILNTAGSGKLVGAGMLLPRKLYSQFGRVWEACWSRDGSCPGSFILNSAGCEKSVGLGWLLPRKLYSQFGRIREACWAGMAPALQALFSIRQGLGSLLPGDDSCPGSFILNPAGCEELVARG